MVELDVEANGHVRNEQQLDLLPEKPKVYVNGVKKSHEVVEKVEDEPPDGGLRAWLVMLGAFFCNGLTFGIINSYGIVFVELKRVYEMDGVDKASSKAALVGSLTIGITFLLSPVAGVLTDLIGIRRTTFLGGAIASSGMLLSSFLVHNVYCLYFTYGIMFGLGASLTYTPSLAILGHYFKKRLGLANGLVTAGSSIFTVIMPIVIDAIIKNFGLAIMLRFLALMVLGVLFCSMLFKPRLTPTRSSKSAVNLDIWKRPKYVIWIIAIPIALFGYFVPYVHIKEFVNENFPDSNGNLPVTCIGLTSGIGRVIFGIIADSPRVNRIILQQISFLCIGCFTMFLTAANSFYLLIALTLGMGLFDGCFISLLGPLAFDLCGSSGATQAIGFLLGMCSIPLTVGPPIAGIIHDYVGSYTLPFLLSGIPPLFGTFVLTFIRCVKDKPLEAADLPLNPIQDPKRQPIIESVTTSQVYMPTPRRASAESLSDSIAGDDNTGSRS